MEKFNEYNTFYKEKADKFKWIKLSEEQILKLLKIAVHAKPYTCNLAEQIVLCRLALDKNINFN